MVLSSTPLQSTLIHPLTRLSHPSPYKALSSISYKLLTSISLNSSFIHPVDNTLVYPPYIVLSSIPLRRALIHPLQVLSSIPYTKELASIFYKYSLMHPLTKYSHASSPPASRAGPPLLSGGARSRGERRSRGPPPSAPPGLQRLVAPHALSSPSPAHPPPLPSRNHREPRRSCVDIPISPPRSEGRESGGRGDRPHGVVKGGSGGRGGGTTWQRE